MNSDATTGAGAALVVGDGGVEIESHSALDPERLEPSPGFFGAFAPFDPSLGEELSPGRSRLPRPRRPREEHRGPARPGERRDARAHRRGSRSSPRRSRRTATSTSSARCSRCSAARSRSGSSLRPRAATGSAAERGRGPARGDRARRAGAASGRARRAELHGRPLRRLRRRRGRRGAGAKDAGRPPGPDRRGARPRGGRSGARLRGDRDRGPPGAQPEDLADGQPDLRDLRRQARRRHRPGRHRAGQGRRRRASRTRTPYEEATEGFGDEPLGGALPQRRRPDRARRAPGARRGPGVRAVRGRGPQAPGHGARRRARRRGDRRPPAPHGRAVIARAASMPAS